MSKNNTIDAEEFNIENLFSDFYVVPDYQREYVWGADEDNSEASTEDDYELDDDPVFRLVDDAYRSWKVNSKAEYFIGTTIVCPADDDDEGITKYEIIDGQQRLTTITLLLLAIRDLLSENDIEVPSSLEKLLHDSDTNHDTGQDVHSLKLSLQYEDAGQILEKLHRHDENAGDELITDSERNIFNAYNKSKSYLGNIFADNMNSLLPFYGYISGRVIIVRINTKSRAKALEIFETINQRGVGLTPMDLLKNLMFVEASSDEFKSIKKLWKELLETINSVSDADRDNPIRFLRYFYNSDYATEKEGIAREKDIYARFKGQTVRKDYSGTPIKFVKKLISAAKVYKNLRSGNAPDGSENIHLDHLIQFVRGTFKQHYPLLLAARNLPSDLYITFSDLVEKSIIVSYVAGVEPNVQERRLFDLTRAARKINDKESLESFGEEVYSTILDQCVSDFTKNMAFLHEGSLGAKYRVRYLLQRIAEYVQTESKGGDSEHFKGLRLKVKNVEHILPQDGKKKAYLEFEEKKKLSEEEIETVKSEYVTMFGNLTLLSEENNKSAGGVSYKKKNHIYSDDEWVISKSMVSIPPSLNGKAKKFHRKYLQTFSDWNAEAMEERQQMLNTLAHMVWGLPTPKNIPSWNSED